MKKIAVVGLDIKKQIHDFIQYLSNYQAKNPLHIDSYIYSDKSFNLYDTLFQKGHPPEDYDAVISVGGDGTFLYTSRIFAGTEVPIFGVNLGRLGFNTTIEIKDFGHYFERFLKGTIEYDYKSLLDITIDGNETVYPVLNEGVISHTGISRMIRLRVDLGGHFICDFRGDGLIISSPTGSTAYNLSAGGPILHPSIDAFAVTPICPHSLAIRPYIVPASDTIRIRIEESQAQPQITLDGQKVVLLELGQDVKITRSKKQIKVVKSRLSFSEILKQKLGWNF
ncbi:MAG: NAD(+)/NADH kinase [Spirochaetes bacterium]|nr:NAD(+)/NADH kinase [Spirochaetota bacterium]